jgi:hypothetical protein
MCCVATWCTALQCNALQCGVPVFHAVSFACEAPDFGDIGAICIYCTAYALFSVGFRLPDFGDFVAIFRHSSPYIKAWRGITAVVHIPGQVRADAAADAVSVGPGGHMQHARARTKTQWPRRGSK